MQAIEKNIRARSVLREKREKVNRKCTQPHRQNQKLTPGFLEETQREVNFFSSV
jgi:RNA polymerase-associated protein LEO1